MRVWLLRLQLAVGWCIRVLAAAHWWWGTLLCAYLLVSAPTLGQGWLRVGAYLIAGSALLLLSHRVGGRLYHRARWRLAPTAAEAVVKAGRKPVLYLRSFEDDRQASTTPLRFAPLTTGLNLRTEEDHLVKAFAHIGPLVALGDPSRLPQVGAARTYAHHENWQQLVLDLMTQARMVLLRIDCDSEPLMWEFQQAVALLAPEQVLLLIPWDVNAYERFRDDIGHAGLLRHPLPPWPKLTYDHRKKVCGAVYFTTGWTPEVIKFRAPLSGSISASLRTDLRPVFANLV